jgi:hypothetical protein
MMSLDAELIAAYQRTEYRVRDGAHAFVLRVEEFSPLLLACHAAHRVQCSAFLTAWNPRSTPTSPDLNRAAMVRLEQALDALGLQWLRGEGIDPAGDWPGEPSLLALGLDEAAAVALARRFAQNAIVCAEADGVPHLVICA